MASAAASIALSLGTSALLVAGCRRIRIPAMLPLLGAGVAMGVSGAGVVDAGSLGDALNGFIKVAIGLLIFEGALHLNREELGRAPRAVWGLLTAGAAITWAGAAVAAHLLLGMSWPIALVLGAALIVTGPTVVQPIIRVLRLSPRLQTTLGAEAVLIDPIGVVATVTTLEVVRLWLTTGLQPGLAGEGLWIFAKPLLSGAGIGTLMGFAGYGLLTLAARSGKAEPQVLNLIAIGTCMACVGIGEAVTHEAGLAAVTICGVIMARARILGASELRAFKELLAVLLVGTRFAACSLPRYSRRAWKSAGSPRSAGPRSPSWPRCSWWCGRPASSPPHTARDWTGESARSPPPSHPAGLSRSRWRQWPPTTCCRCSTTAEATSRSRRPLPSPGTRSGWRW